MYIKFGVDSFIWSEAFTEKDLWIIQKAKDMGFELIDFAISDPFTFPTQVVKAELQRVGMDCVCTTSLTDTTNPVSPDPAIRTAAVKAVKKAVDICNDLGAPILGGMCYASWGYLTRKPRTQDEWNYAVECMCESAEYAKATGNVIICPECVNRFETHILNIAEDAVRFCGETGVDSLAVGIGSAHGFYAEAPKLNIKRLAEINAAVDTKLVLHGGTGIPAEMVQEAIRNGINKINVGTCIFTTHMRTLKESLNAKEDFDLNQHNCIVDAVCEVAREWIRVSMSNGKA